MKIIVTIVLALVLSISVSVAQVYVIEVNTNDVSLVNATDGLTSMKEALDSAIDLANIGNDVRIELNVPSTQGSSLCIATGPHNLPDLSIYDGSISITRSQNASGDQGFDLSSRIAIDGYTHILTVDDNNNSTITISNLSFVETGISLNSARNTEISNCEFSIPNVPDYYHIRAVVTDGFLYNVDLLNNLFQLGKDVVGIGNMNPIQTVSLDIMDNSFYKSSNPSTPLFLKISVDSTSAGTISIEDNYMNGYDCISATADDHIVPNVALEIINNTIHSSNTGLQLVNPQPGWEISDNYFRASEGSIIKLLEAQSEVYFCEYNNSLGILPKNTGNVFDVTNNYSGYSFVCSTSGGIINLIGLDLPGEAKVIQGSGTLIRDCRVVSSKTTDKPIRLHWEEGPVNPNLYIPPPNVTYAGVSGIDVEVQFDLVPVIQLSLGAHIDFVVDFYSTNSNGDLLSYLGSSLPISNMTNPIPDVTLYGAWNSLTSSGRIAFTTNSVGSTGVAPIGTSEAGYINIVEMPPPPTIEPCDCITGFAPDPGTRYMFSAWVKEDSEPDGTHYDNAEIYLKFPGASPLQQSIGPLIPEGMIIDGWQRIEKDFTIPINATELQVYFYNNSAASNAVYIDDVRLFPFASNLKSYVYDPTNEKFVAELDNNNYATIYEYDEEGALIRVKKETNKGIMTIQESRNYIQK